MDSSNEYLSKWCLTLVGAQLVTLYDFNLVSVFEDLNVNCIYAKWSVWKDVLMVATCRFNEEW